MSVPEPEKQFYKNLLDNLQDGVYFIDRSRIITYWNRGAERITGYASDEVIGRSCMDNILMHVDEEGRSLCKDLCPAAACIADGGHRSAEVFLHHKDGHRVPVSVRVAPIANGDAIVGAVEVFNENATQHALRETIDELKKMALYDPVTGLGNRRFGDIKLQAMHHEYKRYGWPFGVLFADLDHFKQINDTFGHDAGDLVLKMVGQTLAHNVRTCDIVARWGGEEFVVLVTNISANQLYAVAEKLRRLVAGSGIRVGAETVRVTVSVGAAMVAPDDTAEAVVKRADELMYRSKAAGRNRTTVLAGVTENE